MLLDIRGIVGLLGDVEAAAKLLSQEAGKNHIFDPLGPKHKG